MKTNYLWAAVEVITNERKPYKQMEVKGFLNQYGMEVLSTMDKMLADLHEGCTCKRFVNMYANNYKFKYNEIDSLLAYVEYLAGKECGQNELSK